MQFVLLGLMGNQMKSIVVQHRSDAEYHFSLFNDDGSDSCDNKEDDLEGNPIAPIKSDCNACGSKPYFVTVSFYWGHQLRQIGDIAADGRVADDVVDAQVDGELLLVERLGERELVGIIVLDAREEVLPGLERQLRSPLALVGEVAGAGGHLDARELLLARLERRDDLLLDQGFKASFLLRRERAGVRLAQRVEAELVGGELLVVGGDDVLRRVAVLGDVLVVQRRDGVEIVAVVLEVGDLPVAVRRLLHRSLEREVRARPVVADLDLRRRRRAVLGDLADADE